MTDYTKSTGSSGTMMIRDTGTYVEFWLKAGSATYNYQLPWSYVVNGVTSGTKEFRFESGGSYQKLGSWRVSTSQTVTFKIGDTGTSGLGGPTTFSQAIKRASIPAAPSSVAISQITSTSLYATFTDGANNGAAIDARQLGYGGSTTTPVWTISSDRSTSITGLVPGTTYYFWARTHNSEGWGPWSPRSSARTLSVPAAPTAPSLSNITPSTLTAKFSANSNGGSAITSYELGYGTSSTAPSTILASTTPSFNVSGLLPGTTYYFWSRAKNAVGYSPWSSPTTNKTAPGVRINVGGEWRNAIPYVNVNGTWKIARPWAKVAGVWRETL